MPSKHLIWPDLQYKAIKTFHQKVYYRLWHILQKRYSFLHNIARHSLLQRLWNILPKRNSFLHDIARHYLLQVMEYLAWHSKTFFTTGYGISCKKRSRFCMIWQDQNILQVTEYHAKTGPVFAGYSLTCSDLQ